MRATPLALLILAASSGCGDECGLDERPLPASGMVQRGRFIANGEHLRVAGSGSDVVREGCGGSAVVLDDSYAYAGDLDIPYDYNDQRDVSAIAVDDDGTIAVVTFDLDYVGDIDENAATRLVLFDANGRRLWSVVLATDDITADYRSVVFAGDLVVVAPTWGAVYAHSRASGVRVWGQTTHASAQGVAIAGHPSGRVTVAAPDALVTYAPDGSVQRLLTPADVGVGGFSGASYADDGSLAVLGHFGQLVDGHSQRAVMLEPSGQVRWSVGLGERFRDRVSSMLTDGTSIVVAGEYGDYLGFDPEGTATAGNDTDGFVSTLGPDGSISTRVINGVGTQRASVVALPTPDTVTVNLTNYEDEADVAEIVIGDVHIDGKGLAIVDLVR